MILEQYLQKAIDAHKGTSHSPEIRGKQLTETYSVILEGDLARIKDPEQKEEYKQKFIRLYLTWLAAKSRCLSTLIAGPSNFNTGRAEKANRGEHNASERFENWRVRRLSVIDRQQRKAEAPDPLAYAKEQLLNRRSRQALMKAANLVCKDKKLTRQEKLNVLSESGVPGILTSFESLPGLVDTGGFPPYKLSNNLAEIKRLEGRVNELEQKQKATQRQETKVDFDGGFIELDFDADRVQIFHDSKPGPDVINKLKRTFNWSRANGCWQRKLTNNGIREAGQITGADVSKLIINITTN